MAVVRADLGRNFLNVDPLMLLAESDDHGSHCGAEQFLLASEARLIIRSLLPIERGMPGYLLIRRAFILLHHLLS